MCVCVRIIRPAKFRKNHYYMLAVVCMIFRVRRAGGADWERGLQIQQVAGTQKHHLCRRTFQVPAVSHHQRRENPHAFQNHLDGPKVLGIFYHFLPFSTMCLPFVGEGWENKYSKLEALSSVSGIPVIQQAFNAANRTPDHFSTSWAPSAINWPKNNPTRQTDQIWSVFGSNPP